MLISFKITLSFFTRYRKCFIYSACIHNMSLFHCITIALQSVALYFTFILLCISSYYSVKLNKRLLGLKYLECLHQSQTSLTKIPKTLCNAYSRYNGSPLTSRSVRWLWRALRWGSPTPSEGSAWSSRVYIKPRAPSGSGCSSEGAECRCCGSLCSEAGGDAWLWTLNHLSGHKRPLVCWEWCKWRRTVLTSHWCYSIKN